MPDNTNTNQPQNLSPQNANPIPGQGPVPPSASSPLPQNQTPPNVPQPNASRPTQPPLTSSIPASASAQMPRPVTPGQSTNLSIQPQLQQAQQSPNRQQPSYAQPAPNQYQQQQFANQNYRPQQAPQQQPTAQQYGQYQQQQNPYTQQQYQQLQYRPQQPTRPATPMSARKPPSPKRLIYGLLSCFGCSIFLFIFFVLLFVSQTSATGENALAKSLGLDTLTFIRTIITLVNIVFGFVAIILFLLAIIGLFRTAMARREDKESRSKGVKLAGVAGGLLILIVFIWVFTYLFLSSRQGVVPQVTSKVTDIVTDPQATLGLTAPVSIKFDGTRLPINGRQYEIISFLWDFGDGESSTVQSPSHTYKDKGKNNGRFDVKVDVTLRDKTTGQETVQTYTDIVTISNVKLNADFTADPEKGPSPLKVKFDASTSSAPAGEIQEYAWDFDNNNIFNEGTGEKIEHTFDKVGTYTVNLRVTDNTGQFATISKEIIVEGADVPTAQIDIPTTDGRYYTGTQYNFSAEKSTTPSGGRITKYEWDFGDQTPKASTRNVTHVYKNAGTYEVTLTVTDEKNATGQATQKITIEPAVGAPIAAITTVPGPAKENDGFISATVPFEVRFDGSKSSVQNGNIVDYKWDFDGDGKEDAAGKQVSYVYKEVGTYNATLTVVDALNKEASAIAIVKVLPQGLQARLVADPVEGVVPLTITFDASGSSYPSGKIVSYEWEFGDGTPKRIDVAKITYQYSQIGTFNAKVTAIASDNTRSTVTTPVTIRSVPLKACFDVSVKEGPAPLTVEFDPRCSTGTIAGGKYNWDFGDGETSKTRKPLHTFANAGSYQVKLQVADNQNVVSTYTMDILVTGTIN